MEFNATFIVAFISFIIFTIIMNVILYKPINGIVQKRKELVDANYQEADENSEKVKSVLQNREDKLLKATDDAKNIVSEKIAEVNVKRDEITSKAKADAKKNVDDYNLYYTNATAEAKLFLRSEVVQLAQAISDKFLGENEKIDIDSHQDLLNSIT